MKLGIGLGITYPNGVNGIPYSPASLFAAGEQGVWYDQSDMSTLFQDAAGTMPVTAVEQPVGLMLDKSNGLVLGPELVPQPLNFTSGWGSAGSVTSLTTNSFTVSAVGGPTFGFPGSAGKRYRISLSGTTNVLLRVRNSSNSTYAFDIQPGAFNTTVEASGVLSVGSSLWLVATAAGTVTIDNISVRELPGNHASQATTTARPILSARYNLLTSTDTLVGGGWAALAPNTTVTPGFSSPLGENTAARVQMSATSGSLLNHPFNAIAGHTYRLRFLARRGGSSTNFSFGFSTTSVGALGNVTVTDLGDVWREFFVDYTAASSGQLWAGIDNVNNGQAVDVLIAGIDLRLAVDVPNLPTYQLVISSSEYSTEGFPHYLLFDGVDDFMSTASTANFSMTSELVAMVAVYVPPEQTTRSTVLELGPSYANPGCIGMEAPMFSATSVGVGYRGNGVEVPRSVSAGQDPIGRVVFGAALELNAPLIQLRVNGTNRQQSTLSVGPGPFANESLFLGARNGSGQRFRGQLYGAVICGKRVLSPELNSLEQFLRTKSRAY